MGQIPECILSFPEVVLPEDQIVFSQGQTCQHYIVVTAGRVRVFARSEEGKELILYRITPGEICILTTACLMGSSQYSAEAITETPVTARILSQTAFNDLLAESETFRHFIFNNFGLRLTNLMVQLEHISFESIEHRLAQYLQQVAQENSIIRITHQEVATEIGSAREVVSRGLKKLEKQGAIKLSRGQIEVLNTSLLPTTEIR